MKVAFLRRPAKSYPPAILYTAGWMQWTTTILVVCLMMRTGHSVEINTKMRKR